MKKPVIILRPENKQSVLFRKRDYKLKHEFPVYSAIQQFNNFLLDDTPLLP